jgi:chromobox protein 1
MARTRRAPAHPARKTTPQNATTTPMRSTRPRRRGNFTDNIGPAALTDDEESDRGEAVASVTKTKSASIAADEDELMGGNGALGGEEEEEEEEDLEPDEFIVESITGHKLDLKTGELRFHVKWEGYDDPQDRTWEPEDNLAESASEILEEYFKQNGGREAVMEDTSKAIKTKKRGRQSAGPSNPGSSKRSKRAASEDSQPPPAGSQEWKPPTGSWEKLIESLDGQRDDETGDLIFFATWKSGIKTRHAREVVNFRCPQLVIKFYERHLKFSPQDD